MSQYLDSLALGDTIDVKGPTGHVHYTGRGRYTLDGEPYFTTHISMIAGGTGITPMYQVGTKIYLCSYTIPLSVPCSHLMACEACTLFCSSWKGLKLH